MYYIVEISCVIAEMWMIHIYLNNFFDRKIVNRFLPPCLYLFVGLCVSVLSLIDGIAIIRLMFAACSIFLYQHHSFSGPCIIRHHFQHRILRNICSDRYSVSTDVSVNRYSNRNADDKSYLPIFLSRYLSHHDVRYCITGMPDTSKGQKRYLVENRASGSAMLAHFNSALSFTHMAMLCHEL